MRKVTYEPELTGLLVVDPYNDFISDGGKLWPQAKDTDSSSENKRPALKSKKVRKPTMTKLEKVLYTAKTHTTGGREGGASRSDDGRLESLKAGS